MISLIASVGKNREIGKNNKLIWRIPNDMKFFRDTTMGHVVVMGRNTYLSLPGDLPGREMIVITDASFDGNVKCVSSIEEVLEKYANVSEEIFIIGGASIYKQFIEYADRLYLTEIDASDSDADTFFPDFDKNEWDKVILDEDSCNGLEYKMCRYDRKTV